MEDERARWARRVAALLRAGTGLADALDVARDETDSFELAGPLAFLARRVRAGATLGEAAGELDEIFAAAESISLTDACTAEELATALERLGPWEPPKA